MNESDPLAWLNKHPFLGRVLFPSRDVRKKMLYIQLWTVVVALFMLIGLAYLLPQYLRNSSPFYVAAAYVAFMTRTFFFHIGLLSILILGLCVWIRSRRLLLTTVILLLISLGPELWSYRPRFPNPVGEGGSLQGKTLTVMSANLLGITRGFEARSRTIIAEIRSARPDVLLLQEYTDRWHEVLSSVLSSELPYSRSVRRNDAFGTAIYSRHPFSQPVNLHVPLGTREVPQVRAVIRLDGIKVAVYNIHLLPPVNLSYFAEHRRQLADLLDVLDREPLPTIVCGDFNFTSRSPHAAALNRSGLTDAHDLAGWGRGATWPVHGIFRWLPGIRLDHLYLRAPLKAVDSRTGPITGSDHRPILVEIIIQSHQAAAAEAAGSVARGKKMLKAVPCPGLLVTRMCPPLCSTTP